MDAILTEPSNRDRLGICTSQFKILESCCNYINRGSSKRIRMIQTGSCNNRTRIRRMRGKLGIELSERSSGLLLLLLLLIEWRRGSGGWRCGRCISTITSSRFGGVVVIEQVRIKQVVVDVILRCDVRRGRREETRQVKFGFGHWRRRWWRREQFSVVFATVTRRLVLVALRGRALCPCPRGRGRGGHAERHRPPAWAKGP